MQKTLNRINRVTQEEVVPSVEASFPYRTDRSDLNSYPGRLCPWHWHNDVEIFFVEKGALTYRVPGRDRVFHEGDVGFINAQVLHSTSAFGTPPSLQHEHIFLPQLVSGAPGSAIERRYVAPLLKNAGADMIFVPAGHERAERMRGLMRRAFAANEAREDGYEIVVRGLMSELWLEFVRLAPDAARYSRSDDNMRVKAMLRFIAENYREHISLAEIAEAARISQREASRCFKRQLNRTPFEYLLNYRIDRACDLLRGTSLSVTEICLNCGFSAPSYFGKMFRERMGQSPREYRKTEE